jgi:hypothetical protein
VLTLLEAARDGPLRRRPPSPLIALGSLRERRERLWKVSRDLRTELRTHLDGAVAADLHAIDGTHVIIVDAVDPMNRPDQNLTKLGFVDEQLVL